MDPFAHTFTGAALAASGLRKTTPLATAALLIGANLPDIDFVVTFFDSYMTLVHRRGWTHGVLAIILLPCLLTCGLLLWDKLVRRRRHPERSAARPWMLLLLSTIAVASHPTLDWLNNYGLRWLMPFDGRWFYGDALFIIDPWIWLVLGGATFLAWSYRPTALVAWTVFGLGASWLVIADLQIPEPAKILWIVGLVSVIALRMLRLKSTSEHTARVALVAFVCYIAANTLASAMARAEVRSRMTHNGYADIKEVMVAPVPANPFKGTVVVASKQGYVHGSWNWLSTPHLVLDKKIIARNMSDPMVKLAAEDHLARRYLSWSRFPYAIIETQPSGYRIQFEDARYANLSHKISGPVVMISREIGQASQ